MRKLILTLSAMALVAPATLPVSAADAQTTHRYHAKVRRHYARCRYSSGTTGLVAGGVGGAVVGHAIGGGLLGTVAGGVGGAFAGRAIDRSMTARRRGCR